MGLYEPGGIWTVCRTVPLSGSIRASEPLLFTTSQILSELAVMPPSCAAGPTLKTDVSELLWRPTFASTDGLPQIGTHRLPNAATRPAHGSPGSATVATTLLVAGSILWTAKGPVLATHTALGVTA